MELVNLTQTTTVVNTSVNNNVVVEVPQTTTVVSGIVGPPGPRGLQGDIGPQGAIGPQGTTGPQGLQGETTLGGAAVVLQDISAGDLIVFNGVSWTNNAKETVTEGGNF